MPAQHQATRLLVSVRNADEAQLALAAGVDLIDVKEPSRGSLGPPDATTIATVLDAVAGRAPVSAALGELADDAAPQVDPRLSFAKLGLAGCGSHAAWQQNWADALRSLPIAVQPVAVVYADWSTAGAPPPGAVLTAAVELGCRAVLVDTFEKSRGHLFQRWPAAELQRFIQAVRRQSLLAVVAGSLRLGMLPAALSLQPDYLAVRGAVCEGPRQGNLCPIRLAEFQAALKMAGCGLKSTPADWRFPIGACPRS